MTDYFGVIGTKTNVNTGFPNVHRGRLKASAKYFVRDDAHPATTVPEAPPTPPTVPCPPDTHTDEGAARLAVEGLHALALANIGQADIDSTVDTYVAPASRQAERDYLHAFQAPLTDVTAHVLGWETVAYTDERATVRFATSEVGSGGAQYINDAVLDWNPPTSSWRLTVWKVQPADNAVALLTNVRGFCDG